MKAAMCDGNVVVDKRGEGGVVVTVDSTRSRLPDILLTHLF